MKYKCLVIQRDIEEYQTKLPKCDLPNLEIIVTDDRAVIEAHIESTDIILGVPFMMPDYLNQAKKLKWIQSSFAGVDALVQPGLRQDYTLTNVKEVYGKPMAEYVFAYVLGLKRDLFGHKEWQSDHHWNQFENSVIERATMGIVGTGSIGREIARIAQAFGMKTKGLKSNAERVEFFDEVYGLDQLDDFYTNLNYVVSVLPNTPKTHDFFDESMFNRMQNSPLFINVGRGNNVDEVALEAALKSKKISGAVLDVFKTEPLPANSSLWDLPNVYITPHVSGYVESDKIFEIFEENYKHFVNGQPLQYQIDFSKGY